ncbi:MAG: 2-hydroxycarboxylate transporter family protein, partial [Cetobacterium sp.]|nr:2-hydroxycarboxylate transporter family protein [Cetobacterium sp.]
MIKNSFIYFIIIYIVISLTIYLNILPKGIFGVIPILMLLGYTFEFLGNSFSFIKTFLGGGPVITIFFSALMVHYHILPQYVIDEIQYVIKDYGLLDIYIAALISGSILG